MAAEDTQSVRSPESHTEDGTASTTMPTTPPPTETTAMDLKAAEKKTSPSPKKRLSTASEQSATAKVTKRRAARACVSCRARKVRCDVVEGAPCGNCRWDGVECVVQESRRRKKGLFNANSSLIGSGCAPHHHHTEAHLLKAKTTPSPIAIASAASVQQPLQRPADVSQNSALNIAASKLGVSGHDRVEPHAASLPYQRPSLIPATQIENHQGSRYASIFPNPTTRQNDTGSGVSDAGAAVAANAVNASQSFSPLDKSDVFSSQEYGFLRPLPSKFAPEDVDYLRAKGALSVPSFALQRALLRAYAEYVHPYMPLLDLHSFLGIVDARDGSRGQTSLFLYQAVMFCATAFVSNKALKEAGYASRKIARRTFFSKARLLYDFDYENDRLLLVQGLLLMTYWYETPDDQKDTWHWMGVAISLGHTIGLHRNPANTNMAPQRRKLWKRIWWSCFMRDRLIALGMRRPTRIKDEDFDVPMLEEEDFDIMAIPDDIQVVDPECTLLRDVAMQRELAQMCVAKAKLSLCISQMLKTQYSVLVCAKTHPENTTHSTMMLLPNKQLDNMEKIAKCDRELTRWAEALPDACKYRALTPLDVQNGRGVIALQRNLLHMVYFTTVSALHRPLFLPSSPRDIQQSPSQVHQQISRMRVCSSAVQITRMVSELSALHLDRFLPTTGVTVILPAMIIHMIEMKNPSQVVQLAAHKGFQQCMRVMTRLRDTYSAADYAVAFVDAAMRKGAQVDQAQHPEAFDHRNNSNDSTSANGFKATMAPQYAASASHGMPNGVENVTTPPPESMLLPKAPEDASVLVAGPTLSSDVVESFAPSSNLMVGNFATTNSLTISNPDTTTQASSGVGTAHSPPSTDILTPGSSEASVGSPSSGDRSFDVGNMDLDILDNGQPDEFDWNAITGPKIDFDQWLQFPPGEGAAVGPGMGLNMCDNGLVALGQIEASNTNFSMGPMDASEDIVMG
ncbi:fungal-specific transcription factor domain-containing protein [Xylaria bambusicola]|uniref:fungal-specific transcription factor domain-containing protein n=1 Tax=Xylaria bambusicola TaxID=326684 RepID=UPI0020089ECC|nr:fungal-specific transcription factor domain-containing protein [Xylaria bambusicola]KAI0525576.1 fungal-specific transcription factor domain-containing protein [Xylaria bambusicola]